VVLHNNVIEIVIHMNILKNLMFVRFETFSIFPVENILIDMSPIRMFWEKARFYLNYI
jgi:hypothetical protein